MKALTAKQFLLELSAFQTKPELENVQRFFRYEGIESKFYEARMSAVRIMDFQATEK